jgi:antitoxin ParD1/3/4
MTMHINLSPEMETFIKGKVASGYYGNATEVIRDAIRRMQAEETRLQAWKAALKKGDDELDAGRSVPYTAAALEEITREAKAPASKPVDPDVLP